MPRYEGGTPCSGQDAGSWRYPFSRACALLRWSHPGHSRIRPPTARTTPPRYAGHTISASVPTKSRPLATPPWKATISFNRRPSCQLPIADAVIRRRTVNGAMRCTRTRFYATSVNILLRTKGIEFTRHCDSCHNPIGVLSGALTQDSQVDRSFDEDGLTCTTCHSIQQLQSTNGNGGFVFGVPSAMVDEDGNRI